MTVDNIENESLVLDLVEWIGPTPRPYRDVMDAWRTSCPRLTIWEEAVDHGLVTQYRSESGAVFVRVTERGAALLKARSRGASPIEAPSATP